MAFVIPSTRSCPNGKWRIGSGGVVARRGVIVVWSIETFRSGIKQVARLLCFSWARSVELESITDEMNGPARGALFWNS